MEFGAGWVRGVAGVGIVLLFLGCGISPALAQTGEPSHLAVQFGLLGFLRRPGPAAAAATEYRHGGKLWIFKPMGGALVALEGCAYAYAGIAVDLPVRGRILARLGFAPGLYHRGRGRDLGDVLEFRSSAEVAYRFENRSRLGLTVFHLSNASLGRINPGTEVVMLGYSLPAGKLARRRR